MIAYPFSFHDNEQTPSEQIGGKDENIQPTQSSNYENWINERDAKGNQEKLEPAKFLNNKSENNAEE